ncbi:bifunctional acetate--CoA ligase family protein/GNAT family N-acetyltransferase [Ampullimonas aquatilis]|uniref:bifunctional acetate--CoA ligase family protein/GNAT family N-acetyltransferase n=1 Tax=Ampullimonas aquatilis TaxID=1341549 RepID=UPI003C77BEA7
MNSHYLTALFNPASIVVFPGGNVNNDEPTELGQIVLNRLHEGGYAGQITVLNIHTSGTLADLTNARADLALIATRPEEVVASLEIAGRIRCRAAIIISTGLDATVAGSLDHIARQYDIQLLGPNCLGLQRPGVKLNAGLTGDLAKPGEIGLITQSGALASAILDWAVENTVGFSTVISLGKHSSLDIADMLNYLASDQMTQSIVVHMEGIKNARRFVSALRAAASAKPVIVLKSGRKQESMIAALTHSGAIIGNDEVFESVLRRAGAVRVSSVTQLFSAAQCLAARYRPVKGHLAIITNGGGPGVLAADRANDLNLKLGKLGSAAIAELKDTLPVHALLNDVLDITEEATPEQFSAVVSAAMNESEVDGVLVICSPKIGVDPTAVAQSIIALGGRTAKPLISCWMGERRVEAARDALSAANIPTFRMPEGAVDAFNNIASYYQNQQLLQQTPPPLSELAQPDLEGARMLIDVVLAERRNTLTEMESKALLSAFHIPVTKTMRASDVNEAVLIASQLGYPVALKIDSPDISHKSDVHGVALNIATAAGVRDTYNEMMQTVRKLRPDARLNGITIQNMSGKARGRELYIGVKTDEPFGPVITFGIGGTMVELINDRAMELPPLNQFLARRLIERSRAANMLGDWHGAPAVDIEALEQILLRVSEMVCELPQLREMDINPVVVDEQGALVVDARIVVGHADSDQQDYAHLAILPYPSKLSKEWALQGGGIVTMRPVHPDDAEMLQQFVRNMSPESRYYRFASVMNEMSPSMLSRYTLIDYDREMALIATFKSPEETSSDVQRMVGISRYIINTDNKTCEFSLAVADDFRGHGLGTRLMRAIMELASQKGLSRIEGYVLSENSNMLKLMRSIGFTVNTDPDDPGFKIVTKVL